MKLGKSVSQAFTRDVKLTEDAVFRCFSVMCTTRVSAFLWDPDRHRKKWLLHRELLSARKERV